jgi:hypothetical protein
MLNKRYKDGTYITRRQFQECFKLNDSQAYSLFRIFDPSGYGRALSLDVWGAITLASSGRQEEKIKYLFDMVDANGDKYIGPIECELLFTCVSRGFSRLKGIPVPDTT